MRLLSCAHCASPFMYRRDNPVVHDTLEAMPINFCSCEHPEPVETKFTQGELRECYWLATEPIAREGSSVSIALDQSLLSHLGWIVVDDDGLLLTKRGRKLFPLLLTIANELQA